MTNERDTSTDVRGRLPWYSPADLTADQLAVYTAIAAGPRSSEKRISPLTDNEGRLEGPFNSMLTAPRVGLALQSVGAAIRYETELTGREREIAILMTAVAEQSSFEWIAHVEVAKSVGVESSTIELIRRGKGHQHFDEGDATIVEFVGSLLRDGDISDELWTDTSDGIGVTKCVELVTLVGYYRALSLGLRVYRVPLPGGQSLDWENVLAEGEGA